MASYRIVLFPQIFQINNFVYESSPNRVVLDFGELSLESATTNGTNEDSAAALINGNGRRSTISSVDSDAASTAASANNVFSKMKRSIAHKSATLTRRSKRRQSGSNSNAGSTTNLTTGMTRKSTSDLLSATTEKPTITAPLAVKSTAQISGKIVKPSVAPPPPPPATAVTATATPTAVVAPMRKEGSSNKIVKATPPLPPLRKSSAVTTAPAPTTITAPAATLAPQLLDDSLSNPVKDKNPSDSVTAPSISNDATTELSQHKDGMKRDAAAVASGDLEDFKIDLTTGAVS